jgi:voltage-gated potassium channel
LGLAWVILLLGGVGFWWLDPHVKTLSDGLWLAFTTAATVGYGDLVPSTHASRAFSVLVVLLGPGGAVNGDRITGSHFCRARGG